MPPLPEVTIADTKELKKKGKVQLVGFGTFETSKGWTKEINKVSWNDKEPKIDIRDWSPDHSKMGKGITLTEEEAKKLKEILK